MERELDVQQLHLPASVPAAGHEEQDVMTQARHTLVLQQQWRDRSARWPTDAELDEFEPIHHEAGRLVKELEALYSADPGSSRLAEISELHWSLLNLSAVPMNRLRTSIRQCEAIKKHEISLEKKG